MNSGPPASTSRVLVLQACTLIVVYAAQGGQTQGLCMLGKHSACSVPCPLLCLFSSPSKGIMDACLRLLVSQQTWLSLFSNTQDKGMSFENKLCSLLPRTHRLWVLFCFVSALNKNTVMTSSPIPLTLSVCRLFTCRALPSCGSPHSAIQSPGLCGCLLYVKQGYRRQAIETKA